MNNIIKTAMVTGFVSAGVLVGGAVSHAADLGSQTTFNSQGQLTLPGKLPSTLGLNVDLNNQLNLTSGSTKTTTVTSKSNQATTKAKSTVMDDAKSGKSQLEVKTDQSSLNGTPSSTLNANMTSGKKVSGNGGATFKGNDDLVSAGGYYISLDHQTGRFTLDAPTLTDTSSSQSQSVVLEEKSTTSPSSMAIDLNGTNELHSSFKNTGLKTTMKQTGGMSITGNANDGKVSADASSTSTSQFDLLGTLTKAFNLQSK